MVNKSQLRRIARRAQKVARAYKGGACVDPPLGGHDRGAVEALYGETGTRWIEGDGEIVRGSAAPAVYPEKENELIIISAINKNNSN